MERVRNDMKEFSLASRDALDCRAQGRLSPLRATMHISPVLGCTINKMDGLI